MRESKTKTPTEGELRVIKSEYKMFDNICRVCLKTGDIPIYGNCGIGDLSEAVGTIGGIAVHIDDVYPKFLCKPCNTLLENAILFRETAQQTEHLLKQPVTEQEVVMEVHKIKEDEEYDVKHDDDSFSDQDEKPLCKVKSTPRKDKKYRCKRCLVDFDSCKEFREHKLSPEHASSRKKCPICSKIYGIRYIKKHLALHKQEMKYMCDICGKKFVIQSQFAKHYATHTDKLPFKCNLCSYRGRLSEALKIHMRSHTGERPYQCAECSMRFISKSNLNRHMLTHKPTRDFKCDTCGKEFRSAGDLRLHIKDYHTAINKKDHICNDCGKAFGHRRQMLKHQLKMHNREKFIGGKQRSYLKVANSSPEQAKSQSREDN